MPKEWIFQQAVLFGVEPCPQKSAEVLDIDHTLKFQP